MTSRTDYDLTVIGGGVAGATLACLLAGAGLRTALVDGRRPEPGGQRVSALNAAARNILRHCGVWGSLWQGNAGPPQPFERMRVWDAGGWGEIVFDAAELGRSELGWIVSDADLRLALWRRCEQHRATLYCPARLAGFGVSVGGSADRLKVELEDGAGGFSTRLLVGADGAQSQVRSLAGIAGRGWGYRQRGLVTTVTPELDHQDTAWQRFLPSGPLALLPLADGRCSVVWSLVEPLAEDRLALPDRAFAEQLSEAFDWRLGELRPAGPRLAFPLRALWVDDTIRSRLALIGDAAHVIHPLAGQGANLGLLDAAVLAEVVQRACQRGGDPGSEQVLRRYRRRRKADNFITLAALDGCARLFGNQLTPLRLVRNLGLNLTDAAGPIKAWLARWAMATEGDLPATALRPPADD